MKSVIFGVWIFMSGFASLGAKNLPQQSNVSQDRAILDDIQSALRANDYSKVGTLLKDNLGKSITIEQITKVAKVCKSQSLLNAIAATKALGANPELNHDRINIRLTRGEFLQIALFIENNLAWHTQRGQYFLPKNRTHLSCALEYDPQTQRTFLLLEQYPNTYIGSGSNKVVNKAMLYDKKEPRIVARAHQTEKKKNEITVTRALRGAPGVFEILACTKYKHAGKKCRIIYARLYKTGSLYRALHRHTFSLYEKAKMAHTLIVGIDELHKRKFAHRDVASRNCLIDIPAGWPGKRDIKIGLADLGRSEHILTGHIDRTKKVQGHSVYTPPEGIYREDMRRNDYLRADIFAMGCVLYEIFHGHTAPWQKNKYFRIHGDSENSRYHDLVKKIKEKSKQRRKELLAKKRKGESSPKEDLECLILRMVHNNKLKRGASGALRWESEQIFNKISKMKE